MDNNNRNNNIITNIDKPSGISKTPRFKTNPFLDMTVTEVERNTVVKQIAGSRNDQKAVVASVDTNTGETFDVRFCRRMYLDETQFVKVFLESLNSFYQLSNAGIRVLTYVLQHIKPNNDAILINREDCKNEVGYKTEKPIYKGLAELIQANIIARGWTDNYYFINPLVIFNGNRVAFANEYIRKQQGDKTPKQILSDNANKQEFFEE